MHAQGSHARRPFRVIGHRHAGVPVRGQNLARIKAKATDGAECACLLPLVVGAECLGSIFNDRQIVPLGNAPEGFHVRALAEQVHNHDGTRTLGDLFLNLKGVKVASRLIDIGKDRPAAQPADCARGGEERERRHDHFIAGAHVQSLQRQEQCVRARGTANRVPGCAITRYLIFKGRDFRAKDHLAAGQYATHGLFDLWLYFLKLSVKVTERNPGSVRRSHVPLPSA